MVKKTILFDIDYTLLDTDIIRNNRVNSIARFVNKNQTEVFNESKRYIDTLVTTKDFCPRELAKHLSMVWGYRENVLYKQIWNIKVVGGCLYPDTEQILKVLKEKFQLGIYSEGFKKLQTFKLKANGIKEYFDPKLIYIYRRKLADLPKVHLQKFIVVDDNKKIVEYLSKFKNIQVIWLNRKTNRRMKKVKTIFNLKELVDDKFI